MPSAAVSKHVYVLVHGRRKIANPSCTVAHTPPQVLEELQTLFRVGRRAREPIRSIDASGVVMTTLTFHAMLVSLVTLTRATQPTSAPSHLSSCRRKFLSAVRCSIMTAGQKQIWAMHYKGDAAALKERNRSFELACQSGADRVTFEGKSDHQIRTQFNDLSSERGEMTQRRGPARSGARHRRSTTSTKHL